MATIAYAISYAAPQGVGRIVTRGVADGTATNEEHARFVRASVYKRAGLSVLPAMVWAPTEPYRGQADASALPDPAGPRYAWDPFAE